MLDTTQTVNWKEHVAAVLESRFAEADAKHLIQYGERLMEQKAWSSDKEWLNQLILEGLSQLDEEEPQWTYIAASLYLEQLYFQASQNRGYNFEEKYGSFYSLIQQLTEIGIYNKFLLDIYSEDEINHFHSLIDYKKDGLFTYIGLRTLADRYLATDHKGGTYELPQERFMIIAMTVMSKEPEETRKELVTEAYWALSNLYMTVATPTLSNSGKSYGQLSSCFIDTVDDSLQGIFDSNTDIANLSKNGGGIGVYLGKIRSRGSAIKGFEGASSGVLPWMKQLNNTAVSVDQLGQRKGAIATYLDIWHKDIFPFLDAKLNNGDERQRTHDLFTGVCLPDIFMEQVQSRGNWYLFDPHEVRRVMGFSLEDFYDETRGDGSFREKYWACVENPDLHKEEIPAINVMKRILRSQLETGGPFMFYRDEVNRQNANKHAGMIYSSNLCTEIMQNQSPTIMTEQVTQDGKIIITKEPGDFVVCNLSSISLAKAVTEDVLERLIPIQVRMLDNVIDLNTIPVLQAQITNQKYRAIGLGTFGWHHLLALKQIDWESDEAVAYADELYEKIAYLTIQSSMKIAKEKGVYPIFEGSDWADGSYFDNKGYTTGDSELDWKGLQEQVKENGMRNAYLMAVAPNSSTALIAGSTATTDPIFSKFYSEEKKDYKIPVTAPDLNEETDRFYKSAYEIDQQWSVKQNAARQKHIDQAISFNMYVPNSIKAKELLDLHIAVWDSGIKTSYYLRSTSN
ncbi:ribonucleoside-diphosphate reductase subunit alpha [Terribacillus saccharophilus]|uniref:Ribonucleoside-diphosphate reductase n=1 Tax=Terribacillus saccharophilus TaxID=361277 RepID=A0A268A847_9BACI|nr:ribonucleoside-diphosphate reductase subunit alpha [Terribacillus saccharophilus]PAD20239.1 ribonucleoside-diphosphate reductase subunit alpha [Terribacillus saccharophilus]PAF18320.1 ribonucleoside-diphosphate reductase subunit alpha [Terribacillus saccharophilus]PAF35785.1 ribonucleoside-diphosphate reductase subunit alpha [Terribacillus saccharophilus]